MLLHITFIAYLLVAVANGQDPTAAPSEASTWFQLITIKRETPSEYLTMETRGADYLDDINPFRTKTTTTTTTTPMPTGSTHPGGADVFQTDFDFDFGGMQHDTTVDFKWRRYTGECPHLYTGPAADHTTGSGWYVYLDASDPRVPGNVARLITPELNTVTGCANITFWYNAYGAHLGRFSVMVAESPYKIKPATVFELKQPVSDNRAWRFASVVAPALKYKIYVEGVVGVGYQGDYGIDDIYVVSSPCPPTSPAALNETTVAYNPGDMTTPTPGGLQTWAIVLIGVCVAAAIAAVVLAVYIVYRQKKARREREQMEKDEEERRKREIEEEGVIHTDRPYSTRIRSSMPADRPVGRMMPSAQRRMAPGYGARPGSQVGSAIRRLDIPASAVSKRGHSLTSSLALQQSGETNYAYDQDDDANILTQTGDTPLGPSSSEQRLKSAAPARPETSSQRVRLPPIMGGETPPSSALGPRTTSDVTISDASPMLSRRGDIGQPATIRPETPSQQPTGKDEKINWFG